MEKNTSVAAVVLAVVAMCNSAALAFAPMGPPRAMLDEGQWAIDAEYSYSQMDLRACGDCAYSAYLAVVPAAGGQPRDEETVSGAVTQRIAIDNLRSNMILASLAYGLCDNWDVYARVGAADARGRVHNGSFRGGFGFAGGLGTRATFCRNGDVTWGGLLQVTWTSPGKDDVTITEPISVGTDDYQIPVTGPMRIRWHEVQAAIGPTLQMASLSVYGGAFLHYVNGAIDWGGTGEHRSEPFWDVDNWYVTVVRPTLACEFDVRERARVGGYIGGMWNVKNGASVYVEGQFTAADYGLMVGGYWPVP